jgi:hypothetical protein
MEQLDLSPYFKTKAQAADFSARLSAIAEAVYKTDFKLDAVLLEQIGVQKRDKFMSLLRDNGVNSESNSDLKTFFDTLQEKIAAMTVLSLTLAFEPKEQTLNAITDWFLVNSNKQILLEIVVDPTLLGGATLTFNGVYKDFSIKQTFVRILQEVVAESAQPQPAQTTPDSPEQHQDINTIHLGR